MRKIHTGAEETQGAKSKSCKKKVLGQQVKLRNLARPGKVAQWDHRGWGYERMFLVSQVMVLLHPVLCESLGSLVYNLSPHPE